MKTGQYFYNLFANIVISRRSFSRQTTQTVGVWRVERVLVDE